MSPEELVSWQRSCGLRRDADAARVLGLSIDAYRRQRRGTSRVSRQTEIIANYYAVHGPSLARIAEYARRAALLAAPAVIKGELANSLLR